MKIPPNIDFFIFDLGNVIIDIDYDFSINELKKILPEHKHDLTAQFFPSQFHKDYEKGEISSEEFRNEVRRLYNEDWTDSQIDHVWNSLLRTIPQERIDLVHRLKFQYGTGILSNTNAIHIEKMAEILQDQNGESSVYSLCQAVFLSHEMGLAKPDLAIYEAVLDEIKIPGKNVLFFDDLAANVEGAKKAGMQSYQITHPRGLVEFFGLI
ncbi:HAD family phosphatase [Cecembia sp.]|uniref:HAD family hydrolase n=1 Tax=Cecembia sp. TaxID=1898110 RepID=UPI0025C31FCD|nr:HAD family phosphatase [Cecembia sp.]